MHAKKKKTGEKLSLYMLVRCNVVLIFNERSTVHDVKKRIFNADIVLLNFVQFKLKRDT